MAKETNKQAEMNVEEVVSKTEAFLTNNKKTILGGIIATLGLVAPSLIVIMIVAAVLQSFRNSRYVNSAFYGLRPASTGMIAAAGLSVMVSNLFYSGVISVQSINWKGWILAIVLWILTNKVKSTKKLHPIVFIGASALVGILFSM